MQQITFKEVDLLTNLRRRISDLNLPQVQEEDKCLVRWLRARNHSLDAAEAMIRQNQLWIRAMNLDLLVLEGDPDSYANNFPWYFFGNDKDGNPGAISRGEMSLCKKSSIKRMELIWRCCQRKSLGKPIMGQAVLIIDMAGLSFSQVTSYEATQLVIQVCRISEQNYPEMLRMGFVINAPTAFRLCYKILHHVLDKNTFSKITVLGSDPAVWRKEIGAMVAFSQFPKKYGGDGDNNLKMGFECD
ncbi:SEC14 cytosolic factor isoform X2 [Folsomia candida]|uniref:SEC14 cytosolic factor isoform X2 n=1 Tax=Folsomia candida TaxID=158441 RepID=UPI001604CA47|nr:SEC14 cytosolic factor isoform X2 [Folsomia candida]